MKQLSILLLSLSFSFMSWGQQISVRLDWGNLLFGSDVNKPSLNYKIGISDNLNYNSKFRFGMEYESFKEINYQQWTFAKLDYEIPIYSNIVVLPGIALSQIYHETTYSKDAFSYAFNLEMTYTINEWLKLSLQANRERATDISQTWRDSIYAGIIIYRE